MAHMAVPFLQANLLKFVVTELDGGTDVSNYKYKYIYLACVWLSYVLSTTEAKLHQLDGKPVDSIRGILLSHV